jgi:hypothetical protein
MRLCWAAGLQGLRWLQHLLPLQQGAAAVLGLLACWVAAVKCPALELVVAAVALQGSCLVLAPAAAVAMHLLQEA